ncbi:hypothetical protein L9F63_023126 [Diploptera punctata]|uniref:UPAR/Ly6 domain-containing protein n=1 Tax=Diploptera punctata TaxID=6984 RepID=A0AAD8E9C9_DIPPU|nr:hypothetical protein L9F63_023126 [Diploptera punctata]
MGHSAFVKACVFSYFAAVAIGVKNNTEIVIKDSSLRCMKCGFDGIPEPKNEASLCLSFGNAVECEDGHVCVRIELHFTTLVKGVMTNDIMGCDVLEEYAANCEQDSEDFGHDLKLPLRSFTCYHCTTSLCNADKIDMFETLKEVTTMVPPTPPSKIRELVKCYTCGYFSMFTLKYIVACNNYSLEIRTCIHTDEVCGLIHIRLSQPAYGGKSSDYYVKQCIHYDEYKTRFALWNKNIHRLTVEKLTCYYCTSNACNVKESNMTNILSGSNSISAYTLLTTFFSVMSFILQ